jgi:hypothetical protein
VNNILLVFILCSLINSYAIYQNLETASKLVPIWKCLTIKKMMIHLTTCLFICLFCINLFFLAVDRNPFEIPIFIEIEALMRNLTLLTKILFTLLLFIFNDESTEPSRILKKAVSCGLRRSRIERIKAKGSC